MNYLVLGAALLRFPAGVVARLFFGQFLFLILGGFAYLASSFAASNRFEYAALSDFLVGVAAYVVVLSLASYSAWLAPVPGAFLLGYGLHVKRKPTAAP